MTFITSAAGMPTLTGWSGQRRMQQRARHQRRVRVVGARGDGGGQVEMVDRKLGGIAKRDDGAPGVHECRAWRRRDPRGPRDARAASGPCSPRSNCRDGTSGITIASNARQAARPAGRPGESACRKTCARAPTASSPRRWRRPTARGQRRAGVAPARVSTRPGVEATVTSSGASRSITPPADLATTVPAGQSRLRGRGARRPPSRSSALPRAG